MDLDDVWHVFFDELRKNPDILSCDRMIYAGIPFVYIVSTLEKQEELKQAVGKAASCAMKGRSLTADIRFVRTDHPTNVYRIRFLVPQQKMFCCGNLCPDCIRFKNQH